MYIGVWRPEVGVKVSIALHATHLKQGLSQPQNLLLQQVSLDSLLWGSFVCAFLGWNYMWLSGPDGIYVNFGDPNFGPVVYIASALIPEPFPQPVMEDS